MLDNGEGIIDWNLIIETDDLKFDDLFSDDPHDPSPPLSSIDDLQQFLMNDDEINGGEAVNVADDFFSDLLLVDSPPDSVSDQSGEVIDHNSKEASVEDQHHDQKAQDDVVVDDDDEDDDPVVAKKRKRRMRNRDAAVRSRERKKEYVRDLELKSKYYEAECRRLGMLLNSCLAENQALRLSLHSSMAFDASKSKQESAVLLMELLPLSSLLWFLGIMCLLLNLPLQLLVAVLLENVDRREEQGNPTPRKPTHEVFRIQEFRSFMIGKRCKASRCRMKFVLIAPQIMT